MAQDGPKMAPRSPKIAQERPEIAQERPEIAQERPKIAPRWPWEGEFEGTPGRGGKAHQRPKALADDAGGG